MRLITTFVLAIVFPLGFGALVVGSFEAISGGSPARAIGGAGLLAAAVILGRWMFKDATPKD